MRALLDTSVLLWWLSQPSRIRPDVMDALREPDAVVLFSQVSLLEIQIKVSLKKLELDFPIDRVPDLAVESGLTALALSNAAIFTLAKLPNVHRDPFDRLLICEAIQEGVAIVTSDDIIHQYPVKVLW
ncbi:MAG: type II toxin-antitoxin system VapC family toxin [Planctomycetota bacterium]